MKTLRLLLVDYCDRECEGCCNKDWDLDNLPYEYNFGQYQQVILTGGEPMLNPQLILEVVDQIKWQNEMTAVILYTAKVDDWKGILAMMNVLDGLTVTLHEQKDVVPFFHLDYMMRLLYPSQSLRLNVFKGVKLTMEAGGIWQIKDNIEWIKNCPLPKNEVFKRYNHEKYKGVE